MRRRGDKVKDPVRRQRERLFNAQVGHGLIPTDWSSRIDPVGGPYEQTCEFIGKRDGLFRSAMHVFTMNIPGTMSPAWRKRHHANSVTGLRADRK